MLCPCGLSTYCYRSCSPATQEAYAQAARASLCQATLDQGWWECHRCEALWPEGKPWVGWKPTSCCDRQLKDDAKDAVEDKEGTFR